MKEVSLFMKELANNHSVSKVHLSIASTCIYYKYDYVGLYGLVVRVLKVHKHIASQQLLPDKPTLPSRGTDCFHWKGSGFGRVFGALTIKPESRCLAG